MMQHLAAHKTDIAPPIKVGSGNNVPDATDSGRRQEFASVLEQNQVQDKKSVNPRSEPSEPSRDVARADQRNDAESGAEHSRAEQSRADDSRADQERQESDAEHHQSEQSAQNRSEDSESTVDSEASTHKGEGDWQAEAAEVVDEVASEETPEPVIDAEKQPAEHFDWLTMLDKIHGQSRDAVIETDGTVPPPETDIPDELAKLTDLQKALKEVVDAQSKTLEEISAEVHGKTSAVSPDSELPDDAPQDEALADILTLIDSLKAKDTVSEEELVQLDQMIDEYMAGKPELAGSPLVALKGDDWMKIDTKLLAGMLQSPNKPELSSGKGTEQLETTEKLAQQLINAEPEQVQKVAEYIAQNVAPKELSTPELKQSFVDKLKSGLEEMKEQMKQGQSGDVSQVVKDALASATEGAANVNVDQAKLQQVIATASSTLDVASHLGEARVPADASRSATGQVASAREINAAQVEASRQQQAAQMEKVVNMNKPDAPQNIAEKVQVMVNQKNMVAEIRLDPPDMGQMKVKLNMTGDTASVNFVVQTQHAREALEHAAPRLKELLDEQGIELGQSSVQQEANGQEQGEEGQLAKGGDGGADNTAEGEEEFTEQHTLNVVNGSVNGIDYFA